MIKTEDITFVAAEAYKRSGLVLSADKGYLLESRLAPLAVPKAIRRSRH